MSWPDVCAGILRASGELDRDGSLANHRKEGLREPACCAPLEQALRGLRRLAVPDGSSVLSLLEATSQGAAHTAPHPVGAQRSPVIHPDLLSAAAATAVAAALWLQARVMFDCALGVETDIEQWQRSAARRLVWGAGWAAVVDFVEGGPLEWGSMVLAALPARAPRLGLGGAAAPLSGPSQLLDPGQKADALQALRGAAAYTAGVATQLLGMMALAETGSELARCTSLGAQLLQHCCGGSAVGGYACCAPPSAPSSSPSFSPQQHCLRTAADAVSLLPRLRGAWEAAARPLRSRSRLHRAWWRWTLLGGAVAGCLVAAHSHREQLAKGAREARDALARFYLEHVSEPLAAIAGELLGPGALGGLGSSPMHVADPQALVDAQANLSRMLGDFYPTLDRSSLSPALQREDLGALAAAGDMRPAFEAFANEAPHALRGAVAGHLLQSSLVQVEFLKKEVLSAMAALDTVMAQNRFNLQLMAAVPALLLMYAGGALAGGLFSGGWAPGQESAQLRVRLRLAVRQLQVALLHPPPCNGPSDSDSGADAVEGGRGAADAGALSQLCTFPRVAALAEAGSVTQHPAPPPASAEFSGDDVKEEELSWMHRLAAAAGAAWTSVLASAAKMGLRVPDYWSQLPPQVALLLPGGLFSTAQPPSSREGSPQPAEGTPREIAVGAAGNATTPQGGVLPALPSFDIHDAAGRRRDYRTQQGGPDLPSLAEFLGAPSTSGNSSLRAQSAIIFDGNDVAGEAIVGGHGVATGEAAAYTRVGPTPRVHCASFPGLGPGRIGELHLAVRRLAGLLASLVRCIGAGGASNSPWGAPFFAEVTALRDDLAVLLQPSLSIPERQERVTLLLSGCHALLGSASLAQDAPYLRRLEEGRSAAEAAVHARILQLLADG